MTFTWDFNTATLMAIGVQVVLLVVFLVKTSNTAKTALAAAHAATALAKEAHEKIATLHGLHSLHREQVAREYVDRTALHDMEARLSGAIDRLSERIDEALHRNKQQQ